MKTLIQTLILVILLGQTNPLHAQIQEYVFKPGDYILMYVYNVDELSSEFKIAGNGLLRLPFVGKIIAAGKSESELKQIITEKLSKYYKNPEITIIPKYPVSVIGEVRSPGVFIVGEEASIMEVIARASGLTDMASGKLVMHRGGEKIKLSLKKIMNQRSPFLTTQAGDIIVARKKVVTVNSLRTMLTTISTISLAVYYYDRATR